jgi:hypothetical protein
MAPLKSSAFETAVVGCVHKLAPVVF